MREIGAVVVIILFLVVAGALLFAAPPTRSYDAAHGVMCYRVALALSCVKTDP